MPSRGKMSDPRHFCDSAQRNMGRVWEEYRTIFHRQSLCRRGRDQHRLASQAAGGGSHCAAVWIKADNGSPRGQRPGETTSRKRPHGPRPGKTTRDNGSPQSKARRNDLVEATRGTSETSTGHVEGSPPTPKPSTRNDFTARGASDPSTRVLFPGRGADRGSDGPCQDDPSREEGPDGAG